MTLLRSLATFLLHSGQADVASATAADVSLAFMQGTVAMTSPVAGFLTCRMHVQLKEVFFLSVSAECIVRMHR